MRNYKLLHGIALSALFLLTAYPAFAAGPDSMAKSDRSLWPDPIDSQAGYDRASRAEILVFSASLADISDMDEAGLKDELHIKSADKTSVMKVRDYLTDILIGNFKIASRSCHAGESFCDKFDSKDKLFATGRKLGQNISGNYRAWYENSDKFHHIYAKELIRLAALFPKTSSEIDVFNDNERNGFELEDGHFLLSFDDGPTLKSGNTDILIKTLTHNNIHAFFYMLGDRLHDRASKDNPAELGKLYDGQCASLHGWNHVSHQKWDKWQSSVLDTQALVKKYFPASYRPYFRPPYAQRSKDSGNFFRENNLTVALWNIDTQDWSSKVNGEDAANRALTLMLLWRRGVFLFHDIHSKAQVAVPWLIQKTAKSGITWDDCHNY